MKYFRMVFYFEAVFLNLLSAVIAVVSPATFLGMFTSKADSGVPLEMLRWYGVLLIDLVYIELKALLTRKNELLALALEGLLLGDILQLGASVFFIINIGEWSSTFIFSIVVTALLAGTRIFWLTQYYRKKI